MKWIIAALLTMTLLLAGCGSSETGSISITESANSAESTVEETEAPKARMRLSESAGRPIEKTAFDLTVVLQSKIREDLPEFTFTIDAWRDASSKNYHVKTIRVTENENEIQNIPIEYLSLNGRTEINETDGDTLGFSLEDLNFDGYLDIRQYDVTDGAYLIDYVYLIWNKQKQQFEYTPELNAISGAKFDQEKKQIYGMQRGSAGSHYYETWEYIDGRPVMVGELTQEEVHLEAKQILEYCSEAGVQTDAAYTIVMYERLERRNNNTGEMHTVTEDYVFYESKDGSLFSDEYLRVSVFSEMGKSISEKGWRIER